MDPSETRRRAIAKLDRRAKEQAVIDAARLWEARFGLATPEEQARLDALLMCTVRALDGDPQ